MDLKVEWEFFKRPQMLLLFKLRLGISLGHLVCRSVFLSYDFKINKVFGFEHLEVDENNELTFASDSTHFRRSFKITVFLHIHLLHKALNHWILEVID